jgi:2,3-bisphosphoglycerate-dependent phosphoglycerate mutase
MHRITFVRHGESIGNAQGRIQGQLDFELTDTGQRQAYALAAYWSEHGVHFDYAISSNLQRARQTAEILTRESHLPVELDAQWVERSFGSLEGTSLADIREKGVPEDLFHLYRSPGGSGESLMDLYLRGIQAVQRLVARPPGSYLVITHGAILQMVLFSILGLTPQENFYQIRFHFGNTSVNELHYDSANNHWSILSINNLSHLTNNL